MPERVKEKLVEIIQNSVGGCARHWAEVIADGLIANGVTVQKWIPVTERLPEDDLLNDSKVKTIKVLVSYKTSMGVPVVRTQIRKKGRRYHRDEWSWAKFEPITHWMPLPEPPKGE